MSKLTVQQHRLEVRHTDTHVLLHITHEPTGITQAITFTHAQASAFADALDHYTFFCRSQEAQDPRSQGR